MYFFQLFSLIEPVNDFCFLPPLQPVQPVEKCGWFSLFCNLLQSPLPSKLLKEKEILISLSQCKFFFSVFNFPEGI